MRPAWQLRSGVILSWPRMRLADILDRQIRGQGYGAIACQHLCSSMVCSACIVLLRLQQRYPECLSWYRMQSSLRYSLLSKQTQEDNMYQPVQVSSHTWHAREPSIPEPASGHFRCMHASDFRSDDALA